MDRLDFTQSIKSNIPLQECIINYFDSILAIYNEMYLYNDFIIEGDFNDRISFTISMENQEILKNLEVKLNTAGIITNVYNTTYKVAAQHYNNKLYIVLM